MPERAGAEDEVTRESPLDMRHERLGELCGQPANAKIHWPVAWGKSYEALDRR